MTHDALIILIVVAIFVGVVAAIFGGLCLYEKITGKWPGGPGGTSSSDSFNDINNSIR